MKISLLVLPFLLAAVSVSAQVNPQCPAVSVDGPMSVPQPGELIPFTVTVKPTESILTYKWTVEYGEIVDGQGTRAIKVRSASRLPTAIVEVGGLPQECPNRASESVSGDAGITPRASKLDSFSLPLSRVSENRFESIAAAVKNNPTGQFYIFLPAVKSVRDMFVHRLYSYIHGDFDLPRVTLIEVSAKSRIIEIWIVPPGATPPSNCEGCGLPESHD